MKVLITLLFIGSAHAGDVTSKITQLAAATIQYANVRLVNPILIDDHPCATNPNFISWDKSTVHGQQMFSLVLAGYMSGREIYFSYSDTQCGLWGTQPLVTRVDLRGD